MLRGRHLGAAVLVATAACGGGSPDESATSGDDGVGSTSTPSQTGTTGQSIAKTPTTVRSATIGDAGIQPCADSVSGFCGDVLVLEVTP